MEKNYSSHFLEDHPLHVYTKNQKNLMKQFSTKSKNPIFRQFFCPKKFLSKIGLRHILGITILHHCAKNQNKLMSQSREKLVTDGRTDGRTTVNLKDLGRSKKKIEKPQFTLGAECN